MSDTNRKEKNPFGEGLPAYTERSLVAWPGVSAERLSLALEGLASPKIGVLTVNSGDLSDRDANFIETLSGQLLGSVLETFDAWLDGVHDLADGGGLSHAAALILAHKLASQLNLTKSILEALVDVHFGGSGKSLALKLPHERTLPVFATLLARAQRADEFIVIVELGEEWEEAQDARNMENALRWLGGPGGLKLWACGAGSGVLQTFLEGRDPVLRALEASSIGDETGSAVRRGHLTPPVGFPHPWSQAEQTLERELDRHNWAAERRWNSPWQAHALAPVYRLDVLFPELACVVEIDGDEHRGPTHYEDDRRRDRTLQAHGLRVLRFTNREVLSDVARVAHEIQTHLAALAGTAGGRQQ